MARLFRARARIAHLGSDLVRVAPGDALFPFNGLDRWGRLGIAEIGVPEFAVLAISSSNSAEEQSRLRWHRATTIRAQSLVQTPSPTASSARAPRAAMSPSTAPHLLQSRSGSIPHDPVTVRSPTAPTLVILAGSAPAAAKLTSDHAIRSQSHRQSCHAPSSSRLHRRPVTQHQR